MRGAIARATFPVVGEVNPRRGRIRSIAAPGGTLQSGAPALCVMPYDSPTMSPSALRSIRVAAGADPRPGMVGMFPQIG